MFIDQYRNDDGIGFTHDGIYYEDAEALIQTGLLGFCGCGRPDDALAYVLAGLELIAESAPANCGRDEFSVWYEGHRARESAHFGTDGAAYFFYYWAAEKGLTEHGGSVPGWLADKGQSLLDMLREWRAEQADCLTPDVIDPAPDAATKPLRAAKE